MVFIFFIFCMKVSDLREISFDLKNQLNDLEQHTLKSNLQLAQAKKTIHTFEKEKKSSKNISKNYSKNYSKNNSMDRKNMLKKENGSALRLVGTLQVSFAGLFSINNGSFILCIPQLTLLRIMKIIY